MDAWGSAIAEELGQAFSLQILQNLLSASGICWPPRRPPCVMPLGGPCLPACLPACRSTATPSHRLLGLTLPLLAGFMWCAARGAKRLARRGSEEY